MPFVTPRNPLSRRRSRLFALCAAQRVEPKMAMPPS